MFTYKQVDDGLKSLAFTTDRLTGRSHCQRVERQARLLGFQSYYHFQQTLRQLPPDTFAGLSLRLMRRICEMRLPRRADYAYFEFIPLPKGVGYYSQWAGWDKEGNEVRVPRPLAGISSVQGMRTATGAPIYVVESEQELAAWQEVWKSTAYIPEKLARKSFSKYFEKEKLVMENPPMDLVKAKINSGLVSNGNFSS